MSDIILQVEHLKKYFKVPKGQLHAVDDVSFSIERGKTLGVVGESGCGKSTLGRTVLGLIDPTDGKVLFEGRDVTHVRGKARRELQKDMQIIFQDPFSSLNPRYCVYEQIAEPLKTYHMCRNRDEMMERVYELMDTVGLARRFATAYPHELDGGRRQRVGIARALALHPDFIVCDEPVSALDVSIQAQILNLLMDLQDEFGLTLMFVTHDLSVVRHISDTIGVMYLGQMVETCSTEELFENQLHPYTKALLSAIPSVDIHKKNKRILLKGELVSPINPKPGCRFAARCPYATEKCKNPQTLEEVRPGHFVSCCRVRELNNL